MNKYLVMLAFLTIGVTGCIESANSTLVSLSTQLLEEKDSEFRYIGEYAYYSLKDKELRIGSDGSVSIMVAIASGTTEVEVCVGNGTISELFVQKFGVKNLTEKSVKDSYPIKEALLWKSVEELSSILESSAEVEVEVEE